jgi:hypothetical protein
MIRSCLLLASLLALTLPAHADCQADIAAADGKAHARAFDIQKSPRAKALWDKANKAAKTLNDRDCKDAVQGLNQLSGAGQ